MNTNFKKQLFLFLRLAVSLGLIAYIFFKISSTHDLSQFPAYYLKADYLWLIGAVFVLIGLLVKNN